MSLPFLNFCKHFSGDVFYARMTVFDLKFYGRMIRLKLIRFKTTAFPVVMILKSLKFL